MDHKVGSLFYSFDLSHLVLPLDAAIDLITLYVDVFVELPMGFAAKLEMPSAENALPGREDNVPVPAQHFVLGRPLQPPFPKNLETVQFGMGCFWGAERVFWQTQGVYTTAVGYAGGYTANPTYEEVCSGGTGHTEVVLVVFDAHIVAFTEILKLFWEGHDPTQGMRQGNDMGTQYRSAIYVSNDAQRQAAVHSKTSFQEALGAAGYGLISTEIEAQVEMFYAEHDHQQYLAKVPNGYCGLGGTGVSCGVP